jgi:hypothetical protein
LIHRLSSRERLTPHDLHRYQSPSLFDHVARVVCEASCLPRKELYESWEVARRARRRFRGGRVVDLACGHGLIAHSATLQSFVHLHIIAIDGVFMREKKGGPAVFHEGRAPSASDVAAVAARVEKRMRRWLRRRGLLDERKAEDRSNEAPALSPIEACMQASLFAGELLRMEEKERPPEEPEAGEARFWAQKKSPWSAEVGGFNVHAGVMIRAGDHAGLEHLLRYAARGPVALSRLSRLADGRVGYRLRKPRKNGATHLVMTPVEFIAEIAAVVPPPKRPLLRLSGVLGPGSSWRASVVPRRGLR